MAKAGSELAFAERFNAAAFYAGFGRSSESSAAGTISMFQNDVALLLYGLYQQATVGRCTVPKPRTWNPVEQGKWSSWHTLGNMTASEAMHLFVKTLEEDDPAWYSRVSEFDVEPVIDVEMHQPTLESAVALAPPKEPKIITTENGNMLETQDKAVIMEGLGSVGVYDQWAAPSISGQWPKLHAIRFGGS